MTPSRMIGRRPRYRQRSMAIAMLCSSLIVAARPASAAAPDDDLGGQLRARVGDRIIQFPSLKTSIKANISGTVATVTVEQTFANPTSTPLNATYLFPLNKDAAVHAMQMRLGDEVITAEIKRREAARQTFEAAQQAGKAAALLEQHRPNMFTQSVANLMPGQPIKVTLKYVQALPRRDGAYRLVLPLVVGPRYIPAGTPKVLARNGASLPVANDADAPGAATPAPDDGRPLAGPSGQWSLGPVPKYPPVAGLTVPRLIESDRVTIEVHLGAGMPIASLLSLTHAIDVTGDDTAKTITLKSGRTIDNRDFVLDYRLTATEVVAGALVHRDASGGYLSLQIEPPASVAPDQVTPREIVFVLDTSGSMTGAPIEASKAFMHQALAALTPNDYFRIIRFANNASEFTAAPVRATPVNLAAADSYVDGLQASGGTEVIPALTQAFGVSQSAGTKRMILFLSDGYVGDEQEILRMVSGRIGRAHTYVLGVGTSVNRYLLAEMAHQGHGFMRVIDPTENLTDAAKAFADKMATTVMTDLSIDWGTLQVSDVVPSTLPDLFAGDGLRIHGRFAGSGLHEIKIKGRINGREAVMPLRIELPSQASTEASDAATGAIPLTWARARIKDDMRQLMTPLRLRVAGLDDGQLQERITKLGLVHKLVTQWTSFVAVSKHVVNSDPAAARDTDVPLPMVKGVGPEAYGKRTQQAALQPPPRLAHLTPAQPMHTGTGNFSGTFAGGATPEPETLIGLLVVLLGLGASLVRRRAA